MYYTSQAFQRVVAKYQRLEKITFALVIASRKLCPYLQDHSIIATTA